MNTLIKGIWRIWKVRCRHHRPEPRSQPGPWGLLVVSAALGASGGLGGCASGLPITVSEAAPQTDATLGLSVRQARVLQTLNLQAGQAEELPQDVHARRALAAWRAGGGASAGRSAGSSREPGGNRGDEGAGGGGVGGAGGVGR